MNTVLVVSNHGEMIGGGEISLLTLLKGLDRSRWVPVVVVPSEGAVADGCRVLGVPVHVIPLPGLRRPGPRVVRSLSALVRLATETRACLLHANGSRAMFYAGLAGRLSGRAVIWHLRISDQDPQLDWLLARMATRIIAISEAVKARLTRWPRAYGYCTVVPNGLDLATFVTAKEPAVVRSSLGIGPEERVIGTVGRLVLFKGHRYLLQAFAGVCLRHPSARLLIVGDGPERDSLERQRHESGLDGTVQFTGHRVDVPDLLSVMEVFVLPSLGEHFGRVLLEAMALEKPVVGTRAGGVLEVVEDGVTGVLVPPGQSRSPGRRDHQTLRRSDPGSGDGTGRPPSRRDALQPEAACGTGRSGVCPSPERQIMKEASPETTQRGIVTQHGRRTLRWRLREHILETRVGRRSVRDLLYPTYVRLYPWLFCMRSFEYEGKRYRYMFHPYGATIRGERIVEVPIALEELNAYAGKRILEVGNVLSHYVPCDHVVADKYEQSDRCLNVDIMEFHPPHRFDCIVSISTVEHIGWNEYEQEPEKAVRALRHMKSLLAPGGRMLVTMPWGQNPALDRHLRSPECAFDVLRYMKRVSSRNTWIQADASVLERACYGKPYPFANVLVLGYLRSRLGA